MAQRLLLTITALLAICTMCHADGHVRGIVTDEKGEAMVSVVIKVYGAGNNKMLKYALSGKDGRFDIPVKDEWLPAKLTFSYIGYRLKEVTVSDTRSDNKITMTEEALSLKEVTVKSAPISSHGDTLLYNVAAFRSASDRNIEDVIRKLPGISVSEKRNDIVSGRKHQQVLHRGARPAVGTLRPGNQKHIARRHSIGEHL